MGNRCPRLWMYILRKRKKGTRTSWLHLRRDNSGVYWLLVMSWQRTPPHMHEGDCLLFFDKFTGKLFLKVWHEIEKDREQAPNPRESKCCCLCQTLGGFSLRRRLHFRLSRIFSRDWFSPPFTSFKRRGTGFDVSLDFLNKKRRPWQLWQMFKKIWESSKTFFQFVKFRAAVTNPESCFTGANSPHKRFCHKTASKWSSAPEKQERDPFTDPRRLWLFYM